MQFRMRRAATGKYGSVAPLNSPSCLRFGDSLRGGVATGVLACVFAVARKVSCGVGRGAATGLAADRAGILHAGGDGHAGAAGENMASGFRARIGLYLYWLGHCVGALQLTVCGSAGGGVILN